MHSNSLALLAWLQHGDDHIAMPMTVTSEFIAAAILHITRAIKHHKVRSRYPDMLTLTYGCDADSMRAPEIQARGSEHQPRARANHAPDRARQARSRSMPAHVRFVGRSLVAVRRQHQDRQGLRHRGQGRMRLSGVEPALTLIRAPYTRRRAHALCA